MTTIDDLPSSLGEQHAIYPIVTEATGFAGDELTVTEVRLSGRDQHSVAPAPLTRDTASNIPVYSCERWLRLRLVTFGYIDLIQLTAPNYAPAEDWAVFIGTSAIYRQPSTGPSTLTDQELPLAAPGLNLTATRDSFGWTSEWIVLQAVWQPAADAPLALQPDPVTLHFDWSATSSPLGISRERNHGGFQDAVPREGDPRPLPRR